MTCDKCKQMFDAKKVWIELCYLHAAAGEMREVCVMAKKRLQRSRDDVDKHLLVLILKLLARTEPKP